MLPRELSLAIVPPPEEPKDRWGRPGRPSEYRPEYIEHARIMCEEGLTDKEIADHFGVCRQTLFTWRKNHPEFAAAFKFGKALADDRMERTAFELATGYTTTIRKKVKLRDSQGNEKIVEVEEELVVPPDAKMLQWLLKNRRPDDWKDKTEQHISGKVEHEHLTVEQIKERVTARLADLRSRQVEQGGS